MICTLKTIYVSIYTSLMMALLAIIAWFGWHYHDVRGICGTPFDHRALLMLHALICTWICLLIHAIKIIAMKNPQLKTRCCFIIVDEVVEPSDELPAMIDEPEHTIATFAVGTLCRDLGHMILRIFKYVSWVLVMTTSIISFVFLNQPWNVSCSNWNTLTHFQQSQLRNYQTSLMVVVILMTIGLLISIWTFLVYCFYHDHIHEDLTQLNRLDYNEVVELNDLAVMDNTESESFSHDTDSSLSASVGKQDALV